MTPTTITRQSHDYQEDPNKAESLRKKSTGRYRFNPYDFEVFSWGDRR